MNEAATIATRLEEIRHRIAAACERVGRLPGGVELVGVSKGQPLDRLQAAWEAGLRVFGENRVQEAEEKAPHMPKELRWHLVGPLQSNKTKRAAALFSAIHSVDRVKIARRLDRDAAEAGRTLRCFLEVNLGEEEAKHGFSPSRLLREARSLPELEHLQIVGLMAIPPQTSTVEEARGWFRRLRQLRDELWSQPWWQSSEEGKLSMGMSGDFEAAIAEGATHVRVGTALFGPRPSAAP